MDPGRRLRARARGLQEEPIQLRSHCPKVFPRCHHYAGENRSSELIVFETRGALDRFKNNQLAFSANATAVAIKAPAAAAATAKYDNGVAIFTMSKGGLMAEASIGGQKFTYRPKADADARTSAAMP